MLQYNEGYGSLPSAAICDKDGNPLLSWRVSLLPFLAGGELYHEFKLDEAWDSPHNLQLLPRMPHVYAPFNGKQTPEPYTTYYQVFVGKGAAFETRKGLRLSQDFPDSTSNTFLIVEAGEPVPWTKPEDLPYAPDQPLPKLGGVFRDRFNVAWADGRVESLKKDLDGSLLRALITPNGGEELADLPGYMQMWK
jgi:prepilin-type processing-associated H-X9-DG protein